MLQFIRDRAQGWIAWVIVGLIIIPFALWGLNEYVGGGGEIAAAEVNGQEISQRRLQETYYRQRERLQQMFGDQLPEELFSEASMKKQLLQQLVEDEMILQSSLSSKMRVGNDQLVATIHSIDAFKESGQFSNELYERVLRMQGMHPVGFEARLRRDLMLQQYRGGIEGSEFTTDLEKKRMAELSQQQRQIEYLTIPVSKFTSSASVTDDEINSYYDANQSRFRTPEMVRVSYVELKQEAIASLIEVDEATQKERYESQILNYKTLEERRARHILITDDDDTKARQDAEAVLARINSGESFEALAKELSQDPGSASQGGDLGFFGLGLMDKAFEDAAYKLQLNETSPVVKSEFGYHIIKLEEIRGGETKSFADVKGEILVEIQQEHAEKGFYDQAELLANLTYEQPDTLQAAADELKLTIQHTPLFGRNGGQGIAKNPKFSQAAFNEDVLQRGNNSEVVELSKSHFVVLRLDEHQPEGIQPLEVVKGVVQKQLMQSKAEQSALKHAGSLLGDLAGGTTLESLSKSEDLNWKSATIKRDAKDVDRTIVSAVFKMAHPKSDETSEEVVKLANGDQVIVILSSVSSKVSDETPIADNSEKVLRKGYAVATYVSVVEQLRSEADIKVNQ